MMTLIIRLCGLCAVSSVIEMMMSETILKNSMRLICGMLMLKMTIHEIRSIGYAIMQQTELAGVLECLMR